jgi:hypothetical protein
VNIDKIRFGNESIAPYLLQEGCPRQQVIASLHHVFEQLKLAWPQIDFSVAALRGSIQEVEFERSRAQHSFARARRQPSQTFSARYQFNNCERLF